MTQKIISRRALKLCLFATICIALGIAATASSAGPMGPVNPIKSRWGLEFEAASDLRQMDDDKTNSFGWDAKNLYFLGRASYGLTEKMEISARLGTADLDVNGITAGAGSFDGSTEFAWGLAIGAILYEAGAWSLAGNVNYLASDGHHDQTKDVLDYSEWGLGLQVQRKYDKFLPYAGLLLSDATIKVTRNAAAIATLSDYTGGNNLGIYVGSGLNISPEWSGYVEYRFEKVASFGGGVRYTF